MKQHPTDTDLIPEWRSVQDSEGSRGVGGINLDSEAVSQLGGRVTLSQLSPIGDGQRASLDVLFHSDVRVQTFL